MTTADLWQRIWQRLGDGAPLFYPESVAVTLGLNLAQRLLCLQKPDLLVQRVAFTVATDQVFVDLRLIAPRAYARVRQETPLMRVSLGDVTTQTPGLTHSREGDLRLTNLTTLRSQPGWFTVRKPFPTHYYTHGLWWLGTWPRAMQDVTLTLVYSAMPSPLSALQPDQESEVPPQWHPLLADIAADVLLVIEGAGECQQAIERLSAVLDAEPLRALRKQLASIAYQQQRLQRSA